MTTKTVQVEGQTYQIGRLGTFDSFEVARRLSFCLSGVALIISQKGSAGIPQFRQSLCALSGQEQSQDVDRATDLCLSVVTRKQGGDKGWAPVYVPGSRQFMFQDIGLPQMTELLWHVLDHNGLFDFFAITPSTSGEGGRVTPR